jgi:hypothetical protein
MKRAMAKQAEAERERRAKVIWSEGELQAASKLAEAARMISSEPAALQLRLYQTMVEVSSAPNMTIVLPVPVELLSGQGPQVVQKLADAAVNARPTSLPAGAARSLGAGDETAEVDRLKKELEPAKK